MSFQQGLSGLNAASKSLDVIGNNIANTGVVGFKASQAQFSDVFASALDGSGNGQIGIGSQVQDIAQQFTQGNISGTNNPLDIAINGKGFFRMSNNGDISYSRNGQFHMDKDGFIVSSDNLRLTGYQIDTAGNLVTTSPSDMHMDTADTTPRSTTAFVAGVNLDSGQPVKTATFNALNPTTFNYSSSGTIFDSLGNPHIFSMYFIKTATNTWQVEGTVDGAVTGAGAPIGMTGLPQTITFSTSGALLTPAAPVTVSANLSVIAPALGAASPLTYTFDMSKSTQFGQKSGITALTQDGYTSGRLTSFNVGKDGIIKGNYSNGQTRVLGQVVLADFINPNGLIPLGRNQWAETPAAGSPLVGTPISGSLGTLQSAAVEDANIDLTAELVNMITAQRAYQANAQTIKTQDAVLQTLINLR
jgi:flagellar hook protein FlgE